MGGCPACGVANVVDARFCSGCGRPFEPALEREVRKAVTILFTDVTGSTLSANGTIPKRSGA